MRFVAFVIAHTRSIAGHGLVIVSQPLFQRNRIAIFAYNSGTMPGSGFVQLPGLVAMAPGAGSS